MRLVLELKRRHPPRQRVFDFIHRSRQRERWFKRLIIATTCLTLAIILGAGYLFFGVRLAMLRLPATSAQSKKHARHLLQASVIYLPLLFALMMIDGVK